MWGDISCSVNGGNVLGGVAYKNKNVYCDMFLGVYQVALASIHAAKHKQVL